MAKKSKSKPAKKTPSAPAAKAKPGAKSAKAKASAKPAKAAPKAKASAKPIAKGKSPAGAKAPQGMRPVSTGSGASPMELGSKLVSLFNTGQIGECEKLWDRSIVSCEGMGVGLEWAGLAAVEAKNAEWNGKHTMLGGAAEGPFVGSTGFAVKFRLHVKVNETGAEMVMNEVGVYTVQNGKIVREEFMYGM